MTPASARMKNTTWLILFLLMTAAARPAFSEQYQGGLKAALEGAGPKLKRGLTEIVTSPAEIPCNIKSASEDHPKAGFLLGLGKGTVFMFRRLLVGIGETVTFFLPEIAPIPPVCEPD